MNLARLLNLTTSRFASLFRSKPCMYMLEKGEVISNTQLKHVIVSVEGERYFHSVGPKDQDFTDSNMLWWLKIKFITLTGLSYNQFTKTFH